MSRNILLIVCCIFLSVRIASAEIVSDQTEVILPSFSGHLVCE